MDYKKIYKQLIEKARGRSKPIERVEIHHMLPRCLGGGDEKQNLVPLLIREHYVAHLLLAKIHGGVCWEAVYGMACYRRLFNSRMYVVARDACLPDQVKRGVKQGIKMYRDRTGIFGMSEEKVIEVRTKAGKAGGKVSGKLTYLRKQGLHSRSSKEHSEAGKKSSTIRVMCKECSMVTLNGPLGGHQRKTGHQGKIRI